jgi:Fe-S cluster biogenesis protein NfuA
MSDSCGCNLGEPKEKSTNEISDVENFRSRVSEAIEKIRPALQMDGGDIQLIDVSNTGEVKVSLHGACATCPHAQMTLKMGVEQTLKDEIPEVKMVTTV